MNDIILIFAAPESIHTKKWRDGLQLVGYNTIVSGISNQLDSNLYFIKGKITSRGGNGLQYLKNIFKFRKILLLTNPIIINAHFLTSYGFISALIKRKRDFLMLSIHGTDIMTNMDRNIFYLMMAKYVFHRSDLIVSVSDLMTAKILKYFPYLEDKIITQQYGLDIELLDSLCCSEKELFITTNRQWKPNSNYPIILEALSDISGENIKIVGHDNSEYANQILTNFKSLVKFSTGLIPYEKNIGYVGRSKIFISLTSSDGISLSLVEAMYLGAIPIVSDIEPNKELIKDGVNGFLVPIEVEALKQKIIEVSGLDDIKIKEIQKYNKNIVLEKFSFKKNFVNLKNELVKRFV